VIPDPDLGGGANIVAITILVDGTGVAHPIVETFGIHMVRMPASTPALGNPLLVTMTQTRSLIESTQWSRKTQIAGLPVDQIKVVDIVPKGIQNYGVRLLANGRFVAFEMFRTRLDALIASTLFKELHRQKDSIDVCKVLGHFSSTDSDLNEWTAKQEAVQAMCENIVTHLKQFMPQDSDQALLNQIEELRRQNAELTAQCKSQTETSPNPPSAPLAKAAGIPSFFPPSSGASPSSAKAALFLTMRWKYT